MKTRKLFSRLLALTLALSLSASALAAGDLDVTKDTHLNRMRNIYNSVTVRSGATLSMENWRPDPPGLEIGKSLTVEAGGKITGGSFIFERGATCEGMELYYKVAGVEKPFSVTLAELIAVEPSADYRPTFLYDLDTGHYVLVADYANDPFETPVPGDGGSGGIDTRTEQLAETLKTLGLFVGSDRGFELDRAPTRVEEVVMLIRLLGKELEALGGSWTHPFTDVPAWADKYIGYAYENSLAGGIGGGKFGTDTPATAQMFATFVLRALGYNDSPLKGDVDFTYAEAIDFAMSKGLIAGQGDIDGFDRGACVRIMEAALRQKKNGGDLLWRELASEGVFTEDAYKAAFGV